MQESLWRKNVLASVCLAVLSLFFSQVLYALGTLDTTGTGTDKSVVVTVPWTFDSGAYAKGFLSFQNGFSLAPSSTLSFETPCPIAGSIHLNHGVLKLTNDIYLGKNATIVGPGYLDPNGNSIYLLDVETISGGPVYVKSAGTFVGNGNILILDTTTGGALDFTAGWGPGGFMHNLRIRNVSNASFITPVGGGSGMDSVALELVPGTVFDFYWNTSIYGNCHITGPGARMNSYGTHNINTGGSLTVDPQTTMRVNANGVVLNAASSMFVLDNARLEVNSLMILYTGFFVIKNSSTIAGISGNILDIGYSGNPDCHFFIEPGATVTLESGTEVRYKNIH